MWTFGWKLMFLFVIMFFLIGKVIDPILTRNPLRNMAFLKMSHEGYVCPWTFYAEWRLERLVVHKVTCFYFQVDICHGDLIQFRPGIPYAVWHFWKMSHNSLIFGLISMKLCSFIPILNRHIVKFKEIENVEKKVAKFYLSMLWNLRKQKLLKKRLPNFAWVGRRVNL